MQPDFLFSLSQKPIRKEWYWAMPVFIGLLFVLKLHLIFLHNVNWDEFLFLAKVHSALRGDLSSALQTAHVHVFAWLPYVSANEVNQVIAARGVMLFLHAGTCGLIFAIGRQLFESTAGATIGVLVYLTFSYVVDHATSFRADPIATFLLMAALWLLVRERGGWLAVAFAGVLSALAGMVTIKSVFYLPTLVLAVLCLRESRSARERWGACLVFSMSALAAFLALYLAHRYSLEAARSYAAMSMVEKSAQKMILFEQFFPGKTYIFETLNRDVLAWPLVLTGFVFAAATALDRKRLVRGIGLLGLGLPLVTLVFYRNAFPYYFVFVLAAPAVLVAGLIAQAETQFRQANGLYFQAALVMLAAVLSASMIARYSRDNVDRTITQRQIIDNVHRMFPHPVPYIDRASMISSFPTAGFFMSTWGMEHYREVGRPIMRDLLVQQQPVFLIANSPGLKLEKYRSTSRYSLIPEDHGVLREHFIPHWGAIWVAGKKLDLVTANAGYAFEILVPGIYTLESDAPVVIDGVERMPGESMALVSGRHEVLSHHAKTSVTLRWGRGLYRPVESWVHKRVFSGFQRKAVKSAAPEKKCGGADCKQK